MEEKPRPIRIGILGCAGIATKICRAITLIADAATIIAIGSRSLDKAEAFSIANALPDAVRCYGSYGEVVDDPEVEAVYVPLPTSLHLQWAVAAAQRKKHVLLEKPAALNLAQLQDILEACSSNGVQFMDGSMWLHHPRTSRMEAFLSDHHIFGQLSTIHSTSSFSANEDFLKHNIRVNPHLDALGALGDLGWYSIGAILWASTFNLPTAVETLPGSTRNSDGVIISCTASMYWDSPSPRIVATFHCSFLTNVSMDLAVVGTHGSLHLQDLAIPFQETTASFDLTHGAKFADLHIGWSAKPETVWVPSELPQESLMVQEFAGLVQGIRDSGRRPETTWPEITRKTQLVLDAVKESIDNGDKLVFL